jgi:hypothetical protein
MLKFVKENKSSTNAMIFLVTFPNFGSPWRLGKAEKTPARYVSNALMHTL